MDERQPNEQGIKLRRSVLGDVHVDAALKNQATSTRDFGIWSCGTSGVRSGAALAVAAMASFLLCSFNRQNVIRFRATPTPRLFVFLARNDCDLAINPRFGKPLLPQLNID
jgi:hypothetical protein